MCASEPLYGYLLVLACVAGGIVRVRGKNFNSGEWIRAAKWRGEWEGAALKSCLPENLGFLNESVHWVHGNVWLAESCEYANQMLFKLWYLSQGITCGANHIYKSLHRHPIIAALVSPVAFITNLTSVALGRNNHQWITDSAYLCSHWQIIRGVYSEILNPCIFAVSAKCQRIMTLWFQSEIRVFKETLHYKM